MLVFNTEKLSTKTQTWWKHNYAFANSAVKFSRIIIFFFFFFFFFFLHWHYSPLWALACRTMSFHFFLSDTNSLHLLTPNSWRSLSPSSSHLFLSLPLLLVPSSSWVKIFLGILSSSILARWPNQLVLCPFMHFTIFSPLFIFCSSRFVRLFRSPFSHLGPYILLNEIIIHEIQNRRTHFQVASGKFVLIWKFVIPSFRNLTHYESDKRSNNIRDKGKLNLAQACKKMKFYTFFFFFFFFFWTCTYLCYWDCPCIWRWNKRGYDDQIRQYNHNVRYRGNVMTKKLVRKR